MASQDQSYRAGEESKGQDEEKMKDQLPSSYSPEMDQSSAPAAGKMKDRGGGLMQRTGEQVRSMAQGAAEKVKQSFGMAEEEDDDDDDEVAAAAGGAAAGRTTTRRTNY